MAAPRVFPVSGVIPPLQAEGRIREAWPSVASVPMIAGLGRALTHTFVLAPLAWMLMSLVFFGKLLPFFMTRYTLTNQRLMIRKGWHGKPVTEVPLAQIDDVRIVSDANTAFFRAGNLEVLSGGAVVLTLRGVPEPDCFRLAILAARNAWVPGRSKSLPFIPASATK
jgi:Bacterial PH domain